MAIIPLRAYNREIEGLIDNSQLDEAVAHCRHILTTYPKHIATYRLLGKAHLEQQRISDATDIFQRVLSSVPDDFIANVGMSIIREDENNLDSSIWHMELAYETQPSNAAIQDELRRLYGRRDGVQPPKVRLTRGALARMYAKGNLYDQAVAELRAAIAEDPNRPDLQVVLAEMFFLTNQRVEAIDTCVNVLKKIPSCLEANRILAVSLPESEGSEAIKNYRQTVIAMDPYFAFATPESITSDQVPENAVNIERLDWKSGIQVPEAPAQPSWATSLGISIDRPSEENVPDWLKTAEPPQAGQPAANSGPSVSPFIWDTQEVHNIITEPTKSEPQLPGWMKDAGWQPPSGEATGAPEATKTEKPVEETPPSENLEKGEIPEWLREMAPQGALDEEKPAEPTAESDLSTPWLEQHQPGPTDSIIHWLEDNKPEKPSTRVSKEQAAAELSAEEMPEWLKDLEPSQPAPVTIGENAAPPSPFSIEPSEIIEEPPAQPASGEIQTPPVESGLPGMPIQTQPKPAAEEEVPDWLRELAGEPVPAAEVAPADSTTAAPPPASSAFEPGSEKAFITEEVPASEAPSPTEIPAPEIPSMTEALPSAAEQPVTEEAPSAELAVSAEELPTAEAPAAGEPTAAVETPTVAEEQVTPEIPTVEIPAPPSEGLTVAEEVAPQEGTPITEGVTGGEVPVVEEAVSAGEEGNIVKEAPLAEMPVEAGQLPVSEVTPVAEEQPAKDLPLPPEQLPTEKPAPPAGEQAAPEAAEIAGEAGALAWLESLAAEHGQKEQPVPTPSEVGEIVPPEWVKLEAEPPLEESLEPGSKPPEPTPLPAKEVPDWIKGLGEEPPTEQAPAEPAAPTEPEMEIPQGGELPAWLQELEEPQPEKAEAAPIPEGLAWKTEELPDWLKEITETMTPPETPAPQAETPAPIETPATAETPVIPEMPAPAEAQVPVEIPTAAEIPAPVEEPVQGEEKAAVEIPQAGIVPAAVELPSSVELPPAPTEPATEWSSDVTPPAGIKREALVETPLESSAMLPETPEVIQPSATVQPEAQAPKPASEELPPSTTAEQVPPAQVEAPAEQPEVSLETFQAASLANQNKLAEARQFANQGHPEQAVASYNDLIQQNYHLDEIIKDLQDALYRYPVYVNMWVSLADAHFRTDNLDEALNAYTKAEELIR